MNRRELFTEIRRKKSCLCVGLDSDIQKLPDIVKSSSDPVFEFNRAIIDASHQYTVAYKPNLAFYESLGTKGWISLEKTVDHIRSVDPSIFIIADAKRGDIGNTASQYARAYFVHFDFDAVTLSPYMGRDS
ncbi:MAG: orotidine-5'-phosphate decarboxylase, partial [Bacteroidetes bacterium]|nr:orotidine-5'-phosphate decarboxylase [Bacteroidota bacterium]